MNRKRVTQALAWALPALAIALGGCAGTTSPPKVHPEALEEAPVCSDCHDDFRTAFDHTPAFARTHGFAADRQRNLCSSCHRPTFCADCHGYEEELKPSEKYRQTPTRSMPHRGDYLSRHRIDGALNPASCFRCHGRRNDWRCLECHR